MVRKTLKVGIMPREQYVKRTIAIAKGHYKPKPGEPKVWFESLQSMAQILSNENQRLLSIIAEQKPASIKELEKTTGRKSSNLSRTLKSMERYGIVDLEKKSKSIRPVVRATDFRVEFCIHHHFM